MDPFQLAQLATGLGAVGVLAYLVWLFVGDKIVSKGAKDEIIAKLEKHVAYLETSVEDWQEIAKGAQKNEADIIEALRIRNEVDEQILKRGAQV